VQLYDPSEAQADKALSWIDTTLADMQEHALVQDARLLRSFIRRADSLNQAAGSADFIQENGPEDLPQKQKILAELDRLAQIQAIIASSTSAIMPSLLFSGLAGRHRFVVAHPMNPPHLAPIVEICGAQFTYPETLERTRQLMQACGQVPIIVKREIDGFILNRLQLAVLNEAFRLISTGHVSAEDLDHTVKDGLALRWSFMGPIETIDLNAPGGIADYLKRYGPSIRRIGKEMAEAPEWPEGLADQLALERRRKVPVGTLESETRWRDQRLMALANHKAKAAEKPKK